MTPPGALAVSGALMVVLAAILAIAVEETRWRRARLAKLGWLALAAGVVALAGSAWWEALR